jgi:hypothetical protein
MTEPNYNEIVIIPFLQKKVQELLNLNLILEAHLLVEQTKNKDAETKINELQGKLNSSKKKKKEEDNLDGNTY